MTVHECIFTLVEMNLDDPAPDSHDPGQVSVIGATSIKDFSGMPIRLVRSIRNSTVST